MFNARLRGCIACSRGTLANVTNFSGLPCITSGTAEEFNGLKLRSGSFLLVEQPKEKENRTAMKTSMVKSRGIFYPYIEFQ